MLLQIAVGFVLIGLSLQQRSDQEIKAWFFTQVLDCKKQYPITAEELMMMKDHKVPDTENSKCLGACVFKKLDWIDASGNYDADKALAWVEKEYTHDAKKLEKAKVVFNTCKSANEATVNDGEKGCDRAYHLSKCLNEHSKNMGFLAS